MFKRWLAIVGAVILIVFTSRLLWGGGGGGDENPWHATTGGGGTVTSSNTGSTTTSTRTATPLKRIFIVRPAPMGGFYLMRIDLPSDRSAKTVAGAQ